MRNDAWDERMARYLQYKDDPKYTHRGMMHPPLNGHPNWSDYLSPQAIELILHKRRVARVMARLTEHDLELLEEEYGLPPIVDDEKDRTWEETNA